MSKILKALAKSNLDNNRGTSHNMGDVLAAISPVNFAKTEFVKEEFSRMVVAAVVLAALTVSGVVSVRSSAALEKTNRSMVELSSLVSQQNRMISQLSARIQETPAVNPQDMLVLKTKVQEIEKTVVRNEEEMTETVISNNLLKIAVDDLQMSENIFVEKYIMLSQDLKNVQEKINTEGRNL